MQLRDFCEVFQSHVRDFEQNWREQAKAEPNKFPLEMEDDEWHEQFDIWCGLNR